MADTLFDEPSAFDREKLAAALRDLARRNIYVGGSSWKYEGWMGQIYTRQNYLTRGKFSRKLFEATCLAEYSRTFPAVCGDFAFYQFPPDEFWRKLFAVTPPDFRFVFKVPEQITCRRFPGHPRYGPQAGNENPDFLHMELLKHEFLRPLEAFGERTAALIFEFGAFSKRSFENTGEFLDRLDPFLSKLPPGFRHAVEVRNPEFLEAGYFHCLRSHNVAHVYNAWSKMPELSEQIAIPDSMTADFMVCRALLRRGRDYEEAVQLFSPYTEVRDPNPEARDSMRVLIRRALDKQQLLLLFVNNRLEGNTPGTVLALLE